MYGGDDMHKKGVWNEVGKCEHWISGVEDVNEWEMDMHGGRDAVCIEWMMRCGVDYRENSAWGGGIEILAHG